MPFGDLLWAFRFAEGDTHLRMVLVDEAFSKMDETRSREVIEYLTESLGLQLIFIMPTSKSSPFQCSALAYLSLNILLSHPRGRGIGWRRLTFKRKDTMKRKTEFVVALISTVMVACGGSSGDSQNDSDPQKESEAFFSESGFLASATYADHPFSAESGRAYGITVESLSGDVRMELLDTPYSETVTALDWWNSTSYPIEVLSFIAPSTLNYYAHLANLSEEGANYTIEVTDNHLETDGAAMSGRVYESYMYYSFGASAGSAYKVTLTPSTGEAHLHLYSASNPDPDANMQDIDIGYAWTDETALLGSSALSGADTVAFVAAETKNHYIRVEHTEQDTRFEIKVESTEKYGDLQVTLDEAKSDGATTTLDYTVSNAGLGDVVGAFNVHFWANPASVPAMDGIGEETVTITDLQKGASQSGTVTIANADGAGTAYALVDSEGAIQEILDSNNSDSQRWAAPVAAPVSYTFEDGKIPVAMLMSGDAYWSMDPSGGSDGSGYSLRSGPIGDGQSSCVSLSASGATQISFDWDSSSDSSDNLVFYVDGSMQADISGSTSWATYTQPVSTGIREYKWCYEKSASSAAGDDAAWIDNIIITN